MSEPGAPLDGSSATNAFGALGEIGIDGFEHPELFVALAIAIAVAQFLRYRARPSALPWPGLEEALRAGARQRDPMRAFGIALRAAALLALAAVLAGPVGIHRAPPEPGLGLDLVLVVDASESMSALDARVAGESRTRLDLAREVVSRFARLRAARGDRVGLVVFGETAFTLCPLSGDGNLLAASLARVEVGAAGKATALGDALGLAVKRALGGTPTPQTPREVPLTELRPATFEREPLAGRVVVLLTDGRNNAGSVPLEVAIALAASTGVRVHTVGIGTAGDDVLMTNAARKARGGANSLPRAFPGDRFERHDVDREALEDISAATGGRFFAATDSRDLDSVYAEIDSLERLARRLPPRIRHTERPEPLLALAIGFALVEIATTRVFRRRTP